MLKILLTGDIHLGRSYQKEAPDVGEKLSAARMQALINAVTEGNRHGCSVMVISGDLFDRVSAIPASLLKETAAALGEFDGDVLIIPGNHDYCGESDTLWHSFQTHSRSNTYVFMKNEKRKLGDAVFYACVCHDKHSAVNSLGWLKDEAMDGEALRIGIAHGAVEGLSMDSEGRYYYMSRNELQDADMDAWLIGHTHIAYPAEEAGTGLIFNAGTPQQTDIADHAVGEAFVLTLEKNQPVRYQKVQTGTVKFVQKTVSLDRNDLRSALRFPEPDKTNTVLRVNLSGIALRTDYEERGAIYGETAQAYLSAEFKDAELKQEITAEMIDRETMSGTKINALLHGYEDEPELLNLAYELAIDCREE